jgi:glutamyl-tRNA synthetase
MAPTPSGFLHLGNIFSFAITASLAGTCGAGVLLRIDDMDSERVAPEFVQDIFDTLQFLDLRWSVGPRDPPDFSERWSQRGRLQLYSDALYFLREKGMLYACRCSRKASQEAGKSGCVGDCRSAGIDLDSPGVSWRLRTRPGATVSMRQMKGFAAFELPVDKQDVILRRRDGLPAYHLCTVVDDAHFGVDLVVRGSDLFSSTIVQLYLSEQLGFQQVSNITFVHHRLLCSPGGGKLSKSAGDTSVQFLRANGASARQIYRQMAQMAGIPPVSHWSGLAGMGLEAILEPGPR